MKVCPDDGRHVKMPSQLKGDEETHGKHCLGRHVFGSIFVLFVKDGVFSIAWCWQELCWVVEHGKLAVLVREKEQPCHSVVSKGFCGVSVRFILQA